MDGAKIVVLSPSSRGRRCSIPPPPPILLSRYTASLIVVGAKLKAETSVLVSVPCVFVKQQQTGS